MEMPSWLVIREERASEDADGNPVLHFTGRIRWWHPRAWQWLWPLLPGPTWRKPLFIAYWLARQAVRRVRRSA